MKIFKLLLLSTIFFSSFVILAPSTSAAGEGLCVCVIDFAAGSLNIAGPMEETACTTLRGDASFCPEGKRSVFLSGATPEQVPALIEALEEEGLGAEAPIITPAPTGPVEWTSPIGTKTPAQVIGKVIKTALGIIGAIALLMFVYGGLMWMTSGGSPEKIKKAQTTLVWAVLGLTVIFASYTLVDFVLKQF